jgi:high affinity choline transporter 7
MGNVYWAGVWAVGAMYAAFLAIGWIASRKVKTASASELILAGRNMPLWIATMTMTATWVDGGYLMGTAEGAFKPDGGIALGLQGGVCFGISLILGGLFFAKKMRQLEYTTLVDPFEERFGKKWAAVLMVPALLGEVIWAAELLAAIGATFAVILGFPLGVSIILAAVVVTSYTVVGGLWSVAYADGFQLSLVPIGMLAALVPVLAAVGGLEATMNGYFHHHNHTRTWSLQETVGWWDVTFMLMLGGIPWNCYFQRVLACRTPTTARWHSFCSGILTILLTIPPLLLGMAAIRYQWTPEQSEALAESPSKVLPFLLRYVTPGVIGLLGLGAIVGAVASSYSASVLSAGSMFSWNVFRRLLCPDVTARGMARVLRGSILLLSAVAVLLALKVKSVQELWFLTADLIFVLLVPQLTYALFDPKCNRIGSMTAFFVALVLRLGGGEQTIGLPPFIPYPELFSGLLQDSPEAWYDKGGAVMLFPFKTLAFAVGMMLLPTVSRLTLRWDAPKPLRGSKVEEPGSIPNDGAQENPIGEGLGTCPS